MYEYQYKRMIAREEQRKHHIADIVLNIVGSIIFLGVLFFGIAFLVCVL